VLTEAVTTANEVGEGLGIHAALLGIVEIGLGWVSCLRANGGDLLMSGFGVEVGVGNVVLGRVGGWEGRLHGGFRLDFVIGELFAWLFGVYFFLTHFYGCYYH